MARYGMTHATLAAALGVSKGAISHKLLGRRPLTIEELGTISAVLEISPADLLMPPRRMAKAPNRVVEGLPGGSEGGTRTRDLTIMSRAL